MPSRPGAEKVSTWRLRIYGTAGKGVIPRGAAIPRSSRPPRSMNGQETEIESALDEPQRRYRGDCAGASRQNDPAIQPGSAQEIGERQKRGNDRDLPHLHPEIEADQRHSEDAFRQPQIGQHAGKAKAVNQAETESHDPAAAANN